MAVNLYVVRKWAGLFMVGVLSLLGFFIGNLYYGFLYSLAFAFGGLLVGVVIANLLINNPFSGMLEGRGILALDITSTGIIRPFIVGVDNNYIRGKVGGRRMSGIFDREAVYNLKTPVKNESGAAQDVRVDTLSIEGERKNIISFKLDEDIYNKARFAMIQYPVILFNSQLNTIVTKDFISDQEKTSFAEHQVIMLNRQLQDLNIHIRDFGRYVVETLKPRSSIWGSKWTWIILIVLFIILAVLFLPAVIDKIGVGTGGAGRVLTEAVTPR